MNNLGIMLGESKAKILNICLAVSLPLTTVCKNWIEVVLMMGKSGTIELFLVFLVVSKLAWKCIWIWFLQKTRWSYPPRKSLTWMFLKRERKKKIKTSFWVIRNQTSFWVVNIKKSCFEKKNDSLFKFSLVNWNKPILPEENVNIFHHWKVIALYLTSQVRHYNSLRKLVSKTRFCSEPEAPAKFSNCVVLQKIRTMKFCQREKNSSYHYSSYPLLI